MNEIEVIADELRQKISDFLIPIQTTKTINYDLFKSMHSSLELLSSRLKGIDLISKSLLNEIYVTIKILRAEAPYFKEDESTLTSMADKFELLFELILKGETLDQRKSGVPRIL